MALKDSVQKKVLCQGIILQPITEHLALGNSDTWQIWPLTSSRITKNEEDV